jgi:hypothetical protein
MSDRIMDCPLCARALTVANRTGRGRYSCPTCAPEWKEAREGWLPLAPAKMATAAKASGLTRILDGDPWFSHDAKGTVITRARTCECGASFTQRQLSARFMEIVEKQGRNAVLKVERDIPDLFVPVHCPPCERKDLGFAARRAHYAEAAD